MSLRFSSPLPSLNGAKAWIGSMPEDDQLRGRPVFVQFWGASCGYCLLNAPLILGWKEQYEPKGLAMLSIHADFNPNIEEIERTIEAHLILTPCALDQDSTLSERFKIGGIVPHYFFFDASHQLRSRASGTRGLHLVEASIRRTLEMPELTLA